MNLFAISEIYHQIFSPHKKEDIFWGQLTFIDGTNPDEDYWETTHIFPPTGDIVQLFITADDNGPSKNQDAFYAQIRANYKKLEKELKKYIYPKWQHVNPDKKKPRKFGDEFSIASLSIPPTDHKTWEMTFFSKSDSKYIYTATLENDVPVKVSRHYY